MSARISSKGQHSLVDQDVPLFIVGSGRSGSTMLRLMLDHNSDLAIPGESHLIPHLLRVRRRYERSTGLDTYRLTADILRSPHVREWGLDEDRFREAVAQLATPTMANVLRSLYQTYADQATKARWGDKTPSYVFAVPLIAELFPDSKFIHLIRDGRDVALSYLARPMFPRTIWQAAWRWRQMVIAGLRGREELPGSRYLEVRYEDLVAEPVSELQRVCSFIGLRFEPTMLSYFADAKERLESPEAFRQFQTGVSQPPRAGFRNWRHEMSAEDVLRFEAANGDVLSDLGYERRFPQINPGRRAIASVHLASVRTRVELSRAQARAERVVSGKPLGW